MVIFNGWPNWGEMNAETEVAELLERVRRQRDEVLRVQRAVAELRVTGASPGGEVRVTVSGGGELAEVTIDPAVFDRGDAVVLGELVRAAVNDGVHRLAEASRDRFAEVVAAAHQKP